MNTKPLLLEKWRSLPKDKQQEVIDFVEFLELKKPLQLDKKPNRSLSPRACNRQREIREEIVASGEPLLDWEGVLRELQLKLC